MRGEARKRPLALRRECDREPQPLILALTLGLFAARSNGEVCSTTWARCKELMWHEQKRSLSAPPSRRRPILAPKSDIEARLLAQARRILSSKVLPPGHGKRRAAPSRQLRSHTRFKSRPLSSDGHRQYGFTLARGLLHSYTWQWPVWHRSLMRDG